MNDGILPDAKACNTCNLLLPLTKFHKNKNCPDGHLSRCKACRKIVDRPYIEAHKEQTRLRTRAWAAANPEAARRNARDWALKNPDRIKQIAAKHRASPQGKDALRKYVLTRDPDRRRLTAVKYYKKNTDRYRAYVRNRRARIRGSKGVHDAADIDRILQLQRYKCANCRCSIEKEFHVDHRHPLSLGGDNDVRNLEILCPTCNLSKGAKMPHIFAQEQGRLL